MEIFTAHYFVTYLNTAVAHALPCPYVYIIYIVHRPTYMIYLIPYYTELFNVLNSQTKFSNLYEFSPSNCCN